MKHFLSFFFLFSLFLLSSCDEEHKMVVTPPSVESQSVDVNLNAKIKTTPTDVHNGEFVRITLTNIDGLRVLDKDEYKNKEEYSIEVEYFIDDKRIGSSSDMKNDFAIDCEVKDFVMGIHSVTAILKSGDKVNLNASIQKDYFNVSPQKANAVMVSLGTYFDISKDLFEFVVPTITYTDSEGEHKTEITPDLCKENSFTLEGILYSNYNRNWDLKVALVPEENYNVTLSFNPKNAVTADPDERYYFNEGFNINSYNYSIKNSIYVGTITNINLNIDISINVGDEKHEKNDGLLGGQYVDEYVRQLCASPVSIKVKLDQDGHIIIDDKQY